MITSDELQIAREAINKMSEGFEDLVNICRSLDKSDQRRLFNPDTFGPISQFLGLGNGYEPGVSGSQFVSSERLLEILEDETDFDDEDLTNDEIDDLTDDLKDEHEFDDYDIPGHIPREM